MASGLAKDGLAWAGPTGLGRLAWADWAGLGWAGLGWAGLGCMGWAGLGWADLMMMGSPIKRSIDHICCDGERSPVEAVLSVGEEGCADMPPGSASPSDPLESPPF